MSSSRQSAWLLFGISLITRIPFLFAGFGREEDAWSQALNARQIAETGVYEVSRLPGHPVYELLLAMLWPLNHEYWFYNSLSALVSALSVMTFYQILRNLSVKQAFSISLVFGFIPVFFIAGTYTIDYNFALLLILWAWLNLQKGKIWLAALSIGVATGFRISSLAFLVPLSLLSGMRSPRQLIRLWIISTLVAIISFTPALMRYGMDFLDFHKPPFPGWASISYKISFGIWGIPLLLSIIGLKTEWLHKGKIMNSIKTSSEFRNLTLAAISAWLLCLLVFARLPFKAEFFIPSLPFLTALLGFLVTRRQSQLLVAAAVMSCFAFGFDYASQWRGATPSATAIEFRAGGKNLFFDPLQGPALIDHSKRLNKSILVNKTLEWAQKQSDSSLVIAGWYWPEIEVRRPERMPVKFDYYSTRDELMAYQQRGYRVYYLPEINEANHLINAHYLADSIGQVLNPL